jgi:uncharacterized protein YjbI with pentapeptide repeats
MNQRHYEIAKKLLQRLAYAVDASFQKHKARPELARADTKEALNYAIAEIGSEADEWCREAFAGETLPLDLSGADLRGYTFLGGRVWQGADFRHAQLDNSQWFFIHVEKADFTGANLQKAYALSLCCDGTRFHEADFTGARLHFYAETEPVDLSRARLSGATVFLSSSSRYVLQDALMSGCSVKCANINLRTREAYDLFCGALSAEQKSQISMGITAKDLAKSDELAAAYRAEAGKPKSGGCFIATACCGSPTHPLVWDLRRFRDEVLLARAPGRVLAATYARVSPPVAEWIGGRPWARTLVRHTVVRPLAWAVRIRAAIRD